jgi:GYF domain 2
LSCELGIGLASARSSRTIFDVAELPYRQPSSAADGAEDEYYIRSQAGAEQKGPYTLAGLRQSLNKQVLRDGTLVRAAGSAEWTTLRELIPKNSGPLKKAFRSHDPRELERAFRSASDPTVGIVLIVAGLALSGLSLGFGSGSGTLFLGLIVIGALRLPKDSQWNTR